MNENEIHLSTFGTVYNYFSLVPETDGTAHKSFQYSTESNVLKVNGVLTQHYYKHFADVLNYKFALLLH